MSFRTIDYQVRPPIAELVLNRPEDHNTFTAELLTELAAATTDLATEPGIRAVVMRGAGTQFCFGADVGMFAAVSPEERVPLIRDLVTKFHIAITRLTRLEVPVLGVAHGTVIGGGLALLAACDLVLATESTRFRLGWPGLGITMDGGATWLLPRIIGLHRTLELLTTNRIFTADEAHAWGFVNWITPDDEIAQRTDDLVGSLAAGPTSAFGSCKRLFLEGLTQPLDAHLENEAVTIVRSFATADADEGIRAFQERRTPQFRGS